ncbi:MAG: sodium:solute symporter family protein [Synergistaceae bacterium]|jgi:SSS family solute:Na+ symporter|nr:sodium:solute symporter family protein [Synergistaceae bacterium]
MKELTFVHLLGAGCVLLLIMGLGIYSGKKVRNVSDFDVGLRDAGPHMVSGTILGTLVGGSATIGVAQLAFNYGLSAWFFTLGSALGCLLLVFHTVPARRSGCNSIQEVILREFGSSAGIVTSVLASLGLVFNIVSQLLAAQALLSTVFQFGPWLCAAVTAVLSLCYVVFGGVNSTGLLGIVKMTLLYAGTLTCGTLAVRMAGGIEGIYRALPHEQYFNLFVRGFNTDVGNGLAVALGVLSTQTYFQAILSGKSDRATRQAVLSSTCLILPIGLFSTCVGYYMRIRFPGLDGQHAFPRFALQYLPSFGSGIVLATLLLAIVGTIAGNLLGLSTILVNNLYHILIDRQADGRKLLLISRILIVSILIFTAVAAVANAQSGILTWSVLSMGLRAVVTLAPFYAALFFSGRVHRGFAVASSILGMVALIVAHFSTLHVDALFPGLGVSIFVIFLGYCRSSGPTVFRKK